MAFFNARRHPVRQRAGRVAFEPVGEGF
jgi:hypothetical protein